MIDRQSQRIRAALPLALLACVAGFVGSCAAPQAESTTEVLALRVDALPDGPGDAVWQRAPFHAAEMIVQDLVEPRLLEPSITKVEVRALTDGSRVALLLRWDDPTRDDLPGASRFSDACAVQFPVTDAPDVPAPQMGESGKGVEITYWRASWQSAVDGRNDEIQALYPNARVDHYPFEAPSLAPGSPEQKEMADQYAPARALGTAMEGPRERSVEDLIAEGPGTLSPAPSQLSTGSGRRAEQGWEVMLVRPMPAGAGGTGRTQIALAVWNGDRDEVGARKMRSVWVPLHVVDEEPAH